MDQRELELKYANLLSDTFYDRLSLRVQEPNIFKILGIQDFEVRHSNFLAWLLDPLESHGLNDIFLQRVLQDIVIDERAKGVSIIELGSLSVNKIEIRREWQNIDILILTEKFVICIENKIWSTEHSNQLNRYRRIIEDNFPFREQLYVFLSPYGYESSENDLYINYSYERIVTILQNIKDGRGHLLNPSIKTYLTDYLILLKQNIMNDDAANLYAKQLYKNHKELFDFVFENKPDIAEEFRKYFEDKVKKEGWVLGSKNKGYVRFYTKKMEGIVPQYKNSNGWPGREGFLFELDYYWNKQKSITFKSIISPGDEKYRFIMAEQISKVDGSKKPWGLKWLVHHTLKFPFVLEKMSEKGDNEIIAEIDKYWPKIVDKVMDVEKSILQKQSELTTITKAVES